jgi:hypothetical protein
MYLLMFTVDLVVIADTANTIVYSPDARRYINLCKLMRSFRAPHH